MCINVPASHYLYILRKFTWFYIYFMWFLLLVMKNIIRIKQIDIANFVGMSPQMISDLRLGRRFLSKTKAKDLSLKIQIPFETLALSTGESLYQWLAQAYMRSYLTQSEDEA